MDENIPLNAVGDVHHLGQVLLNLLGNAVKFTERGSIGVGVTLLDEDSVHLRVRFEVTDTGIGILAGAQAQVFEAFSQADSSTTRRFGGTGLGLAICKRLVALMGGEIGVDSEPGRGSRFWFELPFIKSRQDVAKIRATLPLTRSVNVLLCDDNPMVLRSVASMLLGERVQLTAVANLNAAVAALSQGRAENSFAIAIIDDGVVDGAAPATLSALVTALAEGTTHTIRLGVRARTEANWLPRVHIAQQLLKPLRRSALTDCLRSLLCETQPAPRQIQRAGNAPSRDDFQNIRVLVVEDNRANQEVALGMLERLGASVEIAADGIECIERLQGGRFDLVLMDCHMPRMDGFEATRKIREMAEDFSEIPIIAMTANVQKKRDGTVSGGRHERLSVQADQAERTARSPQSLARVR